MVPEVPARTLARLHVLILALVIIVFQSGSYTFQRRSPPPRIVFVFGRLWSTLDSEQAREGGRERGKEECGLWEGKEVGVNVRKEKHSQFL